MSKLKYISTMKYVYFVLVLCVLSFITIGKVDAQTSTWYYAWENSIQKLDATGNSEIIPIPLNGHAYRILKITNISSETLQLSGFSSSSKEVSSEVFLLPKIKNFRKDAILDLMQPFINRSVTLNKGASAFFLVKYQGIKGGKYNIPLVFNDKNGKSVIVSRTVFVGDKLNNQSLNLNVWAYFNYPLIEGLQDQAVSDLVNHNANVLVIPPSVLPSLTSTSIPNNTPKLNSFLKGLTGKFSYYLVYSNFKNYDDNFVLSEKWKRNYAQWHKLIRSSLSNAGIDYSKVYFYPYDEPNNNQAQKLIQVVNWSKEHNLDVKYYVTLNGFSNVNLAAYVDIIQVINKAQNLTAYGALKNKKSKLWLYDIISEARNRSPLKFLKYGWEAFKYGATGIGVWNYADIGKAYSTATIKSLKVNSKIAASGSWSLKPSSYQRDYSLVYREGNKLYSSLRWEALSQCIQEYRYLELYKSKYGTQQASNLVNQLISGSASQAKWNSIKLALIGGN